MTQTHLRSRSRMGAIAVACAWVVYLPLGLQYLCLLVAAALAIAATLNRPGHWQRMARGPLFAIPLLLWALLALSSLWTPASSSEVMSHLWHYGRLLLVPVIAYACPPDAARRGLRHFVVASALVALLTALATVQWLPSGPWLSSTVESSGNQRIANSLLMALGACMALALAADRSLSKPQRLLWLLACAGTVVGLSLQDRRTGMLALPLLVAALAIAQRRSWRGTAALILLTTAAAGLTWQLSASVQSRFAEGLAELQAYRSTGEVTTSWGMRLRMLEHGADMVREAPLLGHGVGAWVQRWQPRVQGDGPLLIGQATPHNEYVLIAVQVGLVGMALWVAVLVAYLNRAWRSGRTGHAALLVWVAIAWAGLFNVVIRDAKFAVPLLLLAMLAMAASADERWGPGQ